MKQPRIEPDWGDRVIRRNRPELGAGEITIMKWGYWCRVVWEDKGVGSLSPKWCHKDELEVVR